MVGSTDVNSALKAFYQKSLNDLAVEGGDGSITFDYVDDSSHFGKLDMVEALGKAFAPAELKAGDTFEVALNDTFLASSTDTQLKADSNLGGVGASATAATVKAQAVAATLSARATAAKRFRANGNAGDGSAIATETEILEAIIMAGAYAENEDNSSVVYTGMGVAQPVMGANLKFEVDEWRASAGGSGLARTDNNGADLTDVPTHALVKVVANTPQELADASITKFPAASVAAPTAAQVRTAFFANGYGTELARAQKQNLKEPYSIAIKWAYGNDTTTGAISDAQLSLIKARNFGLFDIKPSIAQLHASIGLSDADKTKIADANDADWNAEIAAMTDNADKAKYLKTNVPGAMPINSTFTSEFRVNPEVNTGSFRVIQFYQEMGYAAKGISFAKMTSDLNLTGSSSNANGYQKLTVSAASTSSAATSSWTTVSATLDFTGTMMTTGYNSTSPSPYVAGSSLYNHLAQSDSATGELPSLTGTLASLLKVPLATLVEYSATMLGADNALYSAYVESARRNTAVKNRTQTEIAYIRSKLGNVTGKNSTLLPQSEQWPTQTESAYTLKVSMLEILKTAINGYNGATNADKNARFSDVNINALVVNGDMASRKASSTDTYKQIYSRVTIFQAAAVSGTDGQPNTLAWESGTAIKDEVAIANRIAGLLTLSLAYEGKVRFVLESSTHNANDSIDIDDLKLFVDTLGVNSIKYMTSAAAATDSHIGAVLTTLAATQVYGANRERMSESASVIHFIDMANTSTAGNQPLSVANGKWLKNIYENNKAMFVSAISDVVFNITRGSTGNTISSTESNEFLSSLVGYGMSSVFADLDAQPLDVAVSAASQKSTYLSVFASFFDAYPLPTVGNTALTLATLISSVTVEFSQAVARAVVPYNHAISNGRYVNKSSVDDMTAIFTYTGLTGISSCQVLIPIRALLGDDRQLLAEFNENGVAQPDADRDILLARSLTVELLQYLAYAKSKVNKWTVDATEQKMVYYERVI